MLSFPRLAIYYLNSVSEAYKNSNMELKKKMQMVSRESKANELFVLIYRM